MNKVLNLEAKKQICDALAELLEEKAVSIISVTEIAKKCNLSRQTFYRYFDDIYEAIIWMFDYEVAGCDTHFQTKDFKFSCMTSFSNMVKRPKLYRQIFLSEKSNFFKERFLRSRLQYAKNHIGEMHIDDKTTFATELYWAGYVHMIETWLRTGMKESPEAMAKYAYDSLPAILKPYYL